MALGFLTLGTVIGILAASLLAMTGAGLLLSLGALSLTGTVAVLVAMVVGARCPAIRDRAERG